MTGLKNLSFLFKYFSVYEICYILLYTTSAGIISELHSQERHEERSFPKFDVIMKCYNCLPIQQEQLLQPKMVLWYRKISSWHSEAWSLHPGHG